MQVFVKKMQKNLVMSKKSSTFAAAFEKWEMSNGKFQISNGEAHDHSMVVRHGAIAQLVEQRTENPCVTGSIPVGTTKK